MLKKSKQASVKGALFMPVLRSKGNIMQQRGNDILYYWGDKLSPYKRLN